MSERLIRIIDSRYNLKFTVPDGGCITIDGVPYKLEYVDETHFYTQGQHCHIWDFGANFIDRGRDVRPYDPAKAVSV